MHIVPTRETRKGVRFLLGRVRYHVDEPGSIDVKVIKRGEKKVIIGKKGVYVLDDNLCERLISRAWKDYLDRGYRESPRRGSRSKKEIVEHPVDIAENFLRNFLMEEGVCSCLGVGYLDFETKAIPSEEADRLIERLFEIVSEAGSTKKVSFDRKEIYEEVKGK
jgi:hypothetical protein